MATFRSPAELQRTMRQRAKNLSKGARKSASQAASFMQAKAISWAPRDTGETIRGIEKSKKGKGYVVESNVTPKGKKGFRQNMWANQTAPHRTIRYPKGAWIPARRSKSGKGKIIAGPGTVAVYGISPSGWKWSGRARFWHWATLETTNKFRKLARQNTKKALRVTI